MKNTDLFSKCKLCQHVKEHPRISPLRNFKFSGAKVRTFKRVQKNNSQLKNNNILSTDYQ